MQKQSAHTQNTHTNILSVTAMERKIPERPLYRTSQPPENHSSPSPQRFLYPENYPQTHLMTSLYPSDQTIEAALSRLALSADSRFHAQTPPFNGLPPALLPAEPVPSPMAFGDEMQRALFWAQAQSSNGAGGINGPYRFSGPHQKINVGPDAAAAGFLGGSPYLHAGDRNSVNFHQRQDFGNASSDHYHHFSSFLHGKEPFLMNGAADNCFSVLPFAGQQSSNSYEWLQQLTPGDMRGRIVSLANDQIWSHVLNFKLDKGLSDGEIEMFLPEVIESLGDLLRNQFGSDFVQKLFVACNEDQRTRIIVALTKFPFQLISICLNSLGARGVQNLLQKLTTPQQISLVVSALGLGCVALSTDPNGLHVMQYCVNNFPGEYTKHVFNEIANNFFKIATHRNGCCVLQSCVEKSHGEVRKRLISQIIANGVYLAQDPFGNYVVQHLIGLRMQEVTEDLLRRFRGRFWSFSCDKFASNVVEKFLTESGENNSAAITMELLSSPNAPMLLLHPFGNFVIQSALSVSKGQVRDALLKLIEVNAASMQSNLYGKKILDSIEKGKLPYNA